MAFVKIVCPPASAHGAFKSNLSYPDKKSLLKWRAAVLKDCNEVSDFCSSNGHNGVERDAGPSGTLTVRPDG